MGATTNRTECGIQKFYNTHKPEGYITAFVGIGDDETSGKYAGSKLLFNMTTSDSSKSISLYIDNNYFIKDGKIIYTNAPFGASLDIEILDSNNDVVYTLAKKIPLYGDEASYINSEDRTSLLTSDYKIKVTVHNSSGSGDEEAPANFKVCGYIELYEPK